MRAAVGEGRASVVPLHLDDQQARGVDVAEFTALPGTVPLPSFGACAVTACDRQLPAAAAVYCDTHQLRLWQARRRGAVIDETGWRAVQSPVIRAGRVVFTGLAPLVVIQVLFGLQQRAAQGVKTRDGVLRWICDELRRQQVATLAGARVLPGLGNDRRGTLNSLRTDARRGLLDCETETGKDDWDLTVFGHAGALSFTALSQLWLRAAARCGPATTCPAGRAAAPVTRPATTWPAWRCCPAHYGNAPTKETTRDRWGRPTLRRYCPG